MTKSKHFNVLIVGDKGTGKTTFIEMHTNQDGKNLRPTNGISKQNVGNVAKSNVVHKEFINFFQDQTITKRHQQLMDIHSSSM